jgi:hypothetical protein
VALGLAGVAGGLLARGLFTGAAAMDLVCRLAPAACRGTTGAVAARPESVDPGAVAARRVAEVA